MEAEEQDRERWLSVKEAAAVLGVTTQTVQRWLRAGRLSGTLLNRKAGWRVAESEVQRLLAPDDAPGGATQQSAGAPENRWEHVGRLNLDLMSPLRESIELALGQMRVTLRVIEDGTYDDHLNRQTPGGVVPLVLASSKAPSAMQQAILRGTFLGIIRALGVFVDRLLGLKETISEGLRPPDTLSGLDEFQRSFNSAWSDRTQAIARNKRLSAHEKLRRTASLPEELGQMVSGYLSIRRALEHHEDVPDTDIHFASYTLQILLDEEDITEALPVIGNDGQQIRAGFFPKGRILPAGEKLEFTELEIGSVANTILLWVAPQLVRSFDPNLAQTSATVVAGSVESVDADISRDGERQASSR